MQRFSFEALGTVWTICVDSDSFSTQKKQTIISTITAFEETYSRFIPTSLVSKINAQQKVQKTPELKRMLSFGTSLKKVTDGYFDTNIGKSLGDLGYGKGHQSLDLGGFGKGWLIDTVAAQLLEDGYPHFIIEAGGDVFGTTKKSGQAWKVVLEHPTKPSSALGVISLTNAAIAGSHPLKRTWGNHHHLLDAKTGQPVSAIKVIFTLAKKAHIADGLATCLSVTPEKLWESITQQFGTEYFAIQKSGSHMTPGFASLFKQK